MSEREIMQYDVIIVGAGPSGLACAIRLKQLNPELNVAVIEKAAEVGAHILSGAVIEPAPPSHGPLPTVVRLGRAPLDVLLVLSGVKRQELLLPGVAPIQLREDYSA